MMPKNILILAVLISAIGNSHAGEINKKQSMIIHLSKSDESNITENYALTSSQRIAATARGCNIIVKHEQGTFAPYAETPSNKKIVGYSAIDRSIATCAVPKTNKHH